jgi:hypothetical protein
MYNLILNMAGAPESPTPLRERLVRKISKQSIPVFCIESRSGSCQFSVLRWAAGKFLDWMVSGEDSGGRNWLELRKVCAFI